MSRRIKPRDITALINRAIAAIETPADLTEQERRELVEDLADLEEGRDY